MKARKKPTKTENVNFSWYKSQGKNQQKQENPIFVGMKATKNTNKIAKNRILLVKKVKMIPTK